MAKSRRLIKKNKQARAKRLLGFSPINLFKSKKKKNNT